MPNDEARRNLGYIVGVQGVSPLSFVLRHSLGLGCFVIRHYRFLAAPVRNAG
jgi:hypothetical protein